MHIKSSAAHHFYAFACGVLETDMLHCTLPQIAHDYEGKNQHLFLLQELFSV